MPTTWKRVVPAFPVNRTVRTEIPDPDESGLVAIHVDALSELMGLAGWEQDDVQV
ncbi:hypothetical protein Agsp01_11930 [Agromyces sp. NBRC 114283]|nr:hypothetical protein Agsp01_11930 [Agromyces sp. NBRC 114283]